MKKLAIITPGFMPVPAVKGGAIEQLVQHFIEGNEEKYNYDIDLYTIDDPLLNNYNYKHTNLIRFKDKQQYQCLYKIKYGVLNRVSKLLNYQKSYSYLSDKICQKFKRNFYDIVLVENNMDIYKQLYSKLDNELIIFHLHNDVDCGDLAKTREKTKFILKTADKIIVVSEFLKKKLVQISEVSQDKIYVGYNGIIKSHFVDITQDKKQIFRQKFGLGKNDIVYIFIGRMCSDKGIDKMLLSMRNIDKKDKIHFLIVGNNFFGTNTEDKYINKLKMLANSFKDRIHFTGYIPNNELYKIYSISDCVVIPAQYEEVFGVVALEAMTMGLPVIASVSGGLPEVLSDSCAIFIKRDNEFVLNLKKAILKLAFDKNLRLKLGVKGKERSQKFPQTAEQYFCLINKIIKE